MAHSVCEREGELHKVHSRPFGVDCTQEKKVPQKLGKILYQAERILKSRGLALV